jgi:tetratricopeptide (TPR) repeat protein
LYDRHADFSVRTVGLAGLGALGVSFGTVLAMDAPEARPRGEFNLGSTAWHELAHTFTLGASNNRVPRWVSEGLSVLEERRIRQGWGARANIAFVKALASGTLLPVARLNDGFVLPDGPDRIGLSYYQASLVMEFLEEQHGLEAIRRLLGEYADGRDTDAALRQVTGVSSDTLELRFRGWVRSRFQEPLQAIAAGDAEVIGAPMGTAIAALGAGDTTSAIRGLRAARERFPELGDGSGPAMPLAIALWHAGDRRGALTELAVVTRSDETAVDANLLEAEWRVEIGDSAGALAALERATWIAPNEVETWRRRAVLAAATGQFDDAVQAHRAIVALRPSDPVAARTDLAAALLQSGDRVGARRELLAVLEQAPGYERAQGLLLEARRP